MTGVAGKVFGLIGALAAFPRRLARREIERQGGTLQHGVTRRTSHVVFGRSLVEKTTEAKIEALYDREAGGRQLLSENGLLRALGLLGTVEGSTLGRQSLMDQSGLSARVFDLLALFDAFESDSEPFSFRDLILARKYAGLLASGATWSTIVRSIRRSGPVASLTALSLHVDRNDAIYARLREGLSELDGQVLLPLDRSDDAELEELFALAEEAEESGRHAEAASLYGRCLTIDPGDAIASFNQGNCLRAAGMAEEAARAYMGAIKRDPQFVEAWFNLADLNAAAGSIDAARRNLQRAIALDSQYADAVFNLASLEYDAGNLVEARKWWSRYLDLDSHSEWARTAARGIQLIDLTQRTAS